MGLNAAAPEWTSVDVRAAPAEAEVAGIDVAFQVMRRSLSRKKIHTMRSLNIAPSQPCWHGFPALAGSSSFPVRVWHAFELINACRPQDLSYTVQNRVKKKEHVTLLDCVSGVFLAGQMSALVRTRKCSSCV